MTEAVYGADTAASEGTDHTTGGSAHTKSSWAEIVASTGFEANWVIVQIIGTAAGHNGYLVDIGIGAASSETVLIANLPMVSRSYRSSRTFAIPVNVPSGSRLSIRASASGGGSRVFEYIVRISDAPNFGLSYVETIGADTSATKGTEVDPGGSANTKGSYAQLIASTSDDIDALMVMTGPNNITSITGTPDHLVDIAVGAAASESVVIGDSVHGQNNNEYFFISSPQLYPVEIASGSRIAARAQCSETTVGSREIDVMAIGLKYTAPAGGGGGQAKAGMFGGLG